MTIRFGTDGWRAVIADTFTFENVRLITQAAANWLNKTHTGEQLPEVVIGYDTRFLSDRFAAEVARVFAANNIIAWLTRTDAPTPSISYNVRMKKAAAGVVITASHNPPRYNGFKLKGAHGGSVTGADSDAVEGELERLQAKGQTPRLMDYDEAIEKDLIRRFDPSWPYYEHLTTLADLDKISQAELNIVADAMWGAGRGAFPSLLSRTRCHISEIRGQLNPGFGGIHPEPIARYLNDLSAAVQRTQSHVGLATDGDADRIGAMDATGRFIDPHTIFALVLRQLVEEKGLRGDIVKTLSTTLMIDSLCDKHNLKLHETPVGFNHIADLMMKGDVLMGGEESGGITIRGHVPAGDGILMGLLLLEVLADYQMPLHQIVAELQAQYGPALYERIDVRLAKALPKAEVVKQLVNAAPSHVNGESVVRVDTLDGVKFYLADHSWLLIRPSGTEALLRIYAEARSPETRDALLKLGRTMGETVLK